MINTQISIDYKSINTSGLLITVVCEAPLISIYVLWATNQFPRSTGTVSRIDSRLH